MSWDRETSDKEGEAREGNGSERWQDRLIDSMERLSELKTIEVRGDGIKEALQLFTNMNEKLDSIVVLLANVEDGRTKLGEQMDGVLDSLHDLVTEIQVLRSEAAAHWPIDTGIPVEDLEDDDEVIAPFKRTWPRKTAKKAAKKKAKR